MTKKKNQIVHKPTVPLEPMAGEYLPPVALEGQIVEDDFEEIPHNDQKAIADAVNDLRRNKQGGDDSRIEALDRRLSELEDFVAKMAASLGEGGAESNADTQH